MKRYMNTILAGISLAALAGFAIACSSPLSPDAQNTSRSAVQVDAPQLGAVASFAVFGGGAGATNQGVYTVISGDMGTTGASTMLTGFHSSTFSYAETPLNIGAVYGSVYTAAPEGNAATFAVASAAAADALAAFNDLASRPDGTDPGAGQLGGLTLVPGVYKSAAGSFLVTGGDLVLDAQGNPDAVWIFQMASSLTVGTPTASASVILINGAKASNVFWQVGSAATINGAGGGTMSGTIIASAGLTFSTAGNLELSTLNGRAIALFASITMVNTVIDVNGVAPAIVEPAPIETVQQAVTLSGSNAAGVVAVPGAGFIVVENNGATVSVTETGTGTIDIVNNGGVLTATNTGNGVMMINSNATGAVTVTNTGNGNVTVNATGAEAVTITHSGDEDYTYPVL